MTGALFSMHIWQQFLILMKRFFFPFFSLFIQDWNERGEEGGVNEKELFVH